MLSASLPAFNENDRIPHGDELNQIGGMGAIDEAVQARANAEPLPDYNTADAAEVVLDSDEDMEKEWEDNIMDALLLAEVEQA